MNTGSSAEHRRSGQAGFSMVELLMTAFILAVGLLGLAMLQAMSMRSSTGSKSLNTAVMVGEGVLESIQAEGRQRMLFVKYPGAQPSSTYFNGGTVTQQYSFDGNVPDAEHPAFFTVTITSSNIIARTDTAGGTKQFTVVITFTDSVDTGGVAKTRTATLTRQVAYA